jgi:hypothetical protein
LNPADDVAALIGRGRALLAGRQAPDAIRVFADAYALAMSAGERSTAALALLGQAQAEFAVRRLSDASGHAGTALDLLTVLAMPEAKHAADLIAQIDHYRFLP